MAAELDAKQVQLSHLGCGQRGRVVSIAEGLFARRLTELGFVPGTVVGVRRWALFRDPVELEIRGSRLCLRRSETHQIYVEPLGPGI